MLLKKLLQYYRKNWLSITKSFAWLSYWCYDGDAALLEILFEKEILL